MTRLLLVALAVVAIAATVGFLAAMGLPPIGSCCDPNLAPWVAAVLTPACALAGGIVGSRITEAR